MLFLILNLFLYSRGQEFSYTQYNVKDGLAGSVVYCAAEDKDGFLWFGTESGLSRYDGTHFHNFTTANGLPDNEIIKLFVDSRNRVWIIPFRNSICYYQRGEVHNQDNDPVLHRLSITSEINIITEDRYGNIIIEGAYVIHIICIDGKIMDIESPNAGGGLTKDGLFTFFSCVSSGSYTQYVLDKDRFLLKGKRSFVGKSTNAILISPNLNVFQQGDSLYAVPVTGERFSITMPPSLNSLSGIDDSLFTLNTTNGALMYDLRTKKQFAYFLREQSVNAVIRDSEGNLWFMCAGGGLFRIGTLGFRNVTFREGLSVTSVQMIGNSLYIGTERSGLWRSDPGLQQMTKQEISWHTNKLGRIMAFMPIDKNSLLLGTDVGLLKLDHLREVTVLGCAAVKSVSSTKGNFLISTSQSVEFRRPSDLKKLEYIWPGRSTFSCQQDSLIFFGTLNGLYSVTSNGKPRFWGDIYPVFKTRISAIAASSDSLLWVGTCGQGITGIRNGRLLYALTEKDGLASNTCRAIFISGDDIWVGTDKGLSRVHMDKGHFRITTFGTEDGLSSDIINVVYVNKNDVYAGTVGGLTHFNIDEAAERSFCKLRITSIQVRRATWNYDTSGLILPHHESSIRVDFAGISYRSAGYITYRYRLKGLNNNWQTTRETFLSYPTLPSGTYELEVVATNKFGIGSDPIRVAFTVEQLLWEKAWFIFVAGALLTGMIWVLVWRRIRQLKRKNAEKISINNRMAELEQMSLKAQMNPHFIFNSLNSIQKYVMEKDILGVNKFITDFSRLIRLTLEITSKSRISLDEEVRYISYYLELERVRFGNAFRYDIVIASGIDRMAYYIPPMLLQPYVENSIRHGLRYRGDEKGVILIRFAENKEHLICTIEDNGIGRKQAAQFKRGSPIEYQSRGMTLTARRMEMMNQGRAAPILIDVEDLETGDHLPSGTRIVLCFPIQYVKKITVGP